MLIHSCPTLCPGAAFVLVNKRGEQSYYMGVGIQNQQPELSSLSNQNFDKECWLSLVRE